MTNTSLTSKHYLFASDFDQTLSFNDSGLVLSEMLGISEFEQRVRGLSNINLVQQGGELAYLILHDPEFRRVRREHLIEVGKQIRLKQNIPLLTKFLAEGIEGNTFSFYVISAAPEEVIQSALAGIVPPENIFGTQFNYDPHTQEVESIRRVPAGYGKVAVLENLQRELQITPQNVIYVGDGSSDIHVMLQVNRREGLTIAVSEGKYITSIAQRAILSEDALSVLVPIMEEILGWTQPQKIRAFFEQKGLQIQEWDKVQTDFMTIGELSNHRTVDATTKTEVAHV